MGLFKTIQYRKYQRRRKKLKMDIKAVALQDSVTILMKERKFLDAMRQIKEMLALKTTPWTYSNIIVKYIECLIRKKQYRDITLFEKELLRFYLEVIEISPRRLLSSARYLITISANTKAVHAALLAFYAAILAQRKLEKKPAMKLARESADFIKNIIDHLNGDDVVKQYLLALIRELRDYINATATKKRIQLKNGCLQDCDKIIREVKTNLEREREEQPRPTKLSRKPKRKSDNEGAINSKYNIQKSIHRARSISVSSGSCSEEIEDELGTREEEPQKGSKTTWKTTDKKHVLAVSERKAKAESSGDRTSRPSSNSTNFDSESGIRMNSDDEHSSAVVSSAPNQQSYRSRRSQEHKIESSPDQARALTPASSTSRQGPSSLKSHSSQYSQSRRVGSIAALPSNRDREVFL